jgi:hypothetical protein
MPVSDWPDEPIAPRPDNASSGIALGQSDPRATLRQALHLLHEIHLATTALGDAFVRAGLAPSAWRESDSVLSELTSQFPDVTLDALLTRLAEFAAGTGPAWLAGDGPALDDFERETHLLDDTVRPLRALAQRERLQPPTERAWQPLLRSLADVRVGVQLDRLSRSLHALSDLAPLLVPLPPDESPDTLAGEDMTVNEVPSPSAAPDLPHHPPPAATPPQPAAPQDPVTLAAYAPAPPADAQPMGPPAAPEPGQVPTLGGIPIEGDAYDPDAPTWLSSGHATEASSDAPTVPVWPTGTPPPPGRAIRTILGQRPRTWGLVLATAAALMLGTLALTMGAHALLPPAALIQPPISAARATQTASQLARAATAAAPTPVRPAPTPTQAAPTPAPAAANLVVSPMSLVLPCPGKGTVTLTLSNTGGQSLTWYVSPTIGVTLSAYAGVVNPGALTDISVAATATQRGYIRFHSNGGSPQVLYRVSCH